MPAQKPGYTLSDSLNNADARAFYRKVDNYLNATGTIWSRLANAAEVSPSIRAVVLSQNKGMLRRTHDAIAKAMRDNPEGIACAVATKREYMPLDDTLAFSRELGAYVERTGSDIVRLANMAGREPAGLHRLLTDPIRTSPNVAARFRRIMIDHPDGVQDGTARKQVAPKTSNPTDDELRARREETERLRQERYDQLNAESIRKYGKPLGKPLSEMVA